MKTFQALVENQQQLMSRLASGSAPAPGLWRCPRRPPTGSGCGSAGCGVGAQSEPGAHPGPGRTGYATSRSCCCKAGGCGPGPGPGASGSGGAGCGGRQNRLSGRDAQLSMDLEADFGYRQH